MRVIVVGGGIIGCSLAYYLAKGSADVVLLERSVLAGESSGASAGMLIAASSAEATGPFRRLCVASEKLYRALIPALQRESGLDVEERSSGMLLVAESKASVRTLKRHAERQRESGIRCEWVEGDRLRRLEPGLSGHVLGAAYSPRERHVNPAVITRAFAKAAAGAGAVVRERTAMMGFLGRGDGLYGVRTNHGDELGDAIILAAGPWTGDLTRRLGFPLRTPPMRGQMLAYRSEAVRHTIWGAHGYLVPKPGGIVFAGSTVEDAGFRKQTTKQGLASLRRMAKALVPQLRTAPEAGAWAGLRPGSPDGMPVIGRVPGRANVYIAAGHFRNGVLLAPVTGKTLAELVLHGREDPLIAPYRPARFISKQARPTASDARPVSGRA